MILKMYSKQGGNQEFPKEVSFGPKLTPKMAEAVALPRNAIFPITMVEILTLPLATPLIQCE
jgi:hypothetical protein